MIRRIAVTLVSAVVSVGAVAAVSAPAHASGDTSWGQIVVSHNH